jgi:hypothetical protein
MSLTSFFKKSSEPSRRTKNFLVHINFIEPSSLTETQPCFMTLPFESSRRGCVNDVALPLLVTGDVFGDPLEESEFDGVCLCLLLLLLPSSLGGTGAGPGFKNACCGKTAAVLEKDIRKKKRKKKEGKR